MAQVGTCGRRGALGRCAAFGLALVAAGAARAEPWDVGNTEFRAKATRGSVTATGGPFTITGIGLFCGFRGLNPGKINLYVYDLGVAHQDRPADVTFVLDGRKVAFRMAPESDVHLAAVSRDFVEDLARTKRLQVVALPGRPADTVDMKGADAAIRKALRPCLE